MEVVELDIEKEIFKRSKVNFNKLEKYGFKKDKDEYTYEKNFLNNTFKAYITINSNEILKGKVIDLMIDEEYPNIRVEAQKGPFVNKVRSSYKKILNDIKENCFEESPFISNQANRITEYIYNKYKSKPEFLWEKFKGYGVFRNANNDKWYAMIMNIELSKIDKRNGEAEILNIKLNEDKIPTLLKQKGYYPAYHMNKKDWISIILDDTLKDNDIIKLVDESYNLINDKETWIIPANPKYFDIINCFNDKDEIIWKQSNNIHENDIAYIYAAAPYSSIIYKCKVLEVNIPYEYDDKHISMYKVMKLKLVKKYDPEKYIFSFLKRLGIKAIRGPIKISKSITKELK